MKIETTSLYFSLAAKEAYKNFKRGMSKEQNIKAVQRYLVGDGYSEDFSLEVSKLAYDLVV